MLPEGNLNLQQVIREMEKRISALEAELKEYMHGQTSESTSTPEPPTAD